MDRILLLIKSEENKLKISQEEMLNWFSTFRDTFELHTVIFCKKLNDEIEKSLNYINLGKIEIYENENNDKFHSSAFVPEILKILKNYNPKFIIMNNSSFSRDIGGIISEEMDGLYLNNIIAVENKNGILEVKKSVYGSKYYGIINCEKERAFITVQENIFFSNKNQKYKNQKYKNSIIIKNFLLNEGKIKILQKNKKEDNDEIPLSEAKIVIAGGYGIKNQQDMSILYELAKVVKGSVGGSRALVDKKFISRSKQIGQSGKTVIPNLIFNFGISGQRQFTAGIEGAKTIISINRDKEATIFKYSDYGIVGDLYEIIPIFIEKLSKIYSEE